MAKTSWKPSDRAKKFAANAAEQVIEQLKKGVAPWQKGWDKPTGSELPPFNPVSGTHYRGLNTMVLRMQAEERGYSDPRWVTYRGAQSIGANVRKGERGTTVEYWKFPPKDEDKTKGDDKGGKGGKDEKELERPKIIHRTFTVFNAEQVEKMPPLDKEQQPQQWEACERAERLLKESGADIEHRSGDRAFYRPSQDNIVLPEQKQFHSPESYYSTAVHELGHWTGHEKRMDRETLKQGVKDGFGSENYAKEELRAEMTSMTVNGMMKLPHEPERHAQYVGSWIKTLQNDPNELRYAARDAAKMADYILQYDREKPREVTEAPREAGSTAPSPERQLAARQEPENQPEQTPEVAMSR